jgi:site-specific recombinase XerD
MRRAQQWKKQQGIISEYVFVGYAGKLSRVQVWDQLKTLGKLAGVPELYPHMLRHSRCTYLQADGMPPYQVKDSLGHSDIRGWRQEPQKRTPKRRL